MMDGGRGPWASLRPRIDNPMTWSLPAGRIGGVAVRAHALLLFYVLIEVARSLGDVSVAGEAPLDLRRTLIDLAALLPVILLHDGVRAVACRALGGGVAEMTLRPLGGLVPPRPPYSWRAHAAVHLAGPLTGLILFAILAPTLGALTRTWWTVAFPTPFAYPGWGAVVLESGHQPPWLLSLFGFHRANTVVTLASLLPMLPLNGGSILHALLWPRLGFVSAARASTVVGILVAVVLALAGAVAGPYELMAVALVGGITTVATWTRVEWTRAELGEPATGDVADLLEVGDLDDPFELAVLEPDDLLEQAGSAPDAPAEVPGGAAAEADRLDRILAKISREGIESLSAEEREDLRRATERHQRRTDRPSGPN